MVKWRSSIQCFLFIKQLKKYQKGFDPLQYYSYVLIVTGYYSSKQSLSGLRDDAKINAKLQIDVVAHPTSLFFPSNKLLSHLDKNMFSNFSQF